jgi:gamma-glutamylaminecyclotransferase
MSENNSLVAVYGTLRQGGRWHHLLSESLLLDFGYTYHSYALYLAEYPCVNKEQALYPIRVEVYKVTPQTLHSLDELEEHPNIYLRELIPVLLDKGEQIQAWLYFFPNATGQLLQHGDFVKENQVATSRDRYSGNGTP